LKSISKNIRINGIIFILIGMKPINRDWGFGVGG
jgi:hypothetical protein